MTAVALVLLTLQPFLQLFTASGDPATLSGRVVDGRSGAPVDAAEVSLSDGFSGHARYRTRTDDRGAFILSGVPEGRYRLSFAASGRARHEESVHLEPGEHLQVLVRLQSGPDPVATATPFSGRGGPRSAAATATDLPRADPVSLAWPPALGRSASLSLESRGGDDPGPWSVRMRGFTSERFSVELNGVTLNDPETGEVAWTDLVGLRGVLAGAQVRRGAEAATGVSSAFMGAIDLLAAPQAENPTGAVLLSAGSLGRRIVTAEGESGPFRGSTRAYGTTGLYESDGFLWGSGARMIPVVLGATHIQGASTYSVLLLMTPYSGGFVESGLPPEVDRDHINRSGAGSRSLRTDQGRFVPHLIFGHDRPLGIGVRFTQSASIRFGSVWNETDGARRPSSYLRLAGIPRDVYQLPLREWLPGAEAVVRHHRNLMQLAWNPRVSLVSAWGETSLQMRTGFARSHWNGAIEESRGLPDGAADASVPIYEFRSGASWSTLSLHHLAPLGRRVTLRADLAVGYSASRVFDVAWFEHEFSRTYWFTNPRVGLEINPGGFLSGFSSLAVANRAPSILQLYNGLEAPADAAPRFPVGENGRYATDRPEVRSEIAFDLETGVRAVRHRWMAQATRFSTRLKDLIAPAAALNASGMPDVGNAGSARVKGWELEGAWRPLDPLRIEGSFALLDASYETYYIWSSLEDGSVGLVNRSGSDIGGIPSGLLRFSAGWVDGPWNGGVHLDRVGSRAVGESDAAGAAGSAKPSSPDIPAYTSLDLWGGYETRFEGIPGAWHARLDLRNVLNADIVGMGIAGPDGPEFFPLAGRTLHLTLRYQTP